MSMQTDVTDPITRAFLDKINAAKGPQIYELSPQEARKVLSKVQEVSVKDNARDH